MMDPQAAHRVAKLDQVLREVPYQYQNKSRLRSDVAQLLQTCKTLQPQTGTFQGSGRQVHLFYLYGVVPITYHGSTYNIPVTIYFDPPYPKQPPRCFVTPTAGMALKPNHNHVDGGGMVYLPYLQNWSESTSQLPQLVSTMASVFSTSPPVHSTTSQQRPTQAEQAAQPAGQGPLSGVLGFLGLGGQQSSTPAAATPVATPATPVVTAVPVPKPAQPVATVIATTVHRENKDDVMKAVSKTMKDRWPGIVEPLTKELKEQMERKEELETASRRLQQEEQRLKDAVVQVQRQSSELQSTEGELETFIQAECGRENFDPDAFLESMDPDRRQVLDCLSEELSYEELLMALDELLAEKKIGVEDFMREVRDVSRQQFMCKMKRKKAEKAVNAANGVEEATAAPTVPVAKAVAMPVAPAAPAAPAPRTAVAA